MGDSPMQPRPAPPRALTTLSRAAKAALLAALVAIVAPLPASAERVLADRLSGAELRRELSGNTVTGVHDNGMPYSEFHHPDGRVFGHNNHEPVVEGCWDIKGDEVCYYYAGGSVQGTFCWQFSRAGAGYRLLLARTGTNAIGLLQAGNPHNHSDNGKPWTCEPLISQNFTPRRLARR
jgi:hypothetical protein